MTKYGHRILTYTKNFLILGIIWAFVSFGVLFVNASPLGALPRYDKVMVVDESGVFIADLHYTWKGNAGSGTVGSFPRIGDELSLDGRLYRITDFRWCYNNEGDAKGLVTKSIMITVKQTW